MSTAPSNRFASLPCFQHVQWHPDRRELRRFACWMLGGFAVLGGLAAWRTGGIGTAAIVLWTIGVTLSVMAPIPRLGRAAYLLVYVVSGIIGYLISRVVLTVMFYFVFTPIGLLLKGMGRDLLQLRRPEQSMWVPHAQRQDRESYYRQF